MNASRTRAAHLAWYAALLLSLAGCGGGGGSSDTAAPIQPPTQAVEPPLGEQCLAGSVARLALAGVPTPGRNTELSLLSCGGPLTDVRWAQSSGPALGLMSARSQALSLEPAAPGSYAFALSYSDETGKAHAGTASVTVVPAADAAPLLTVRGEPSVWAGGSLSLRAWAPGLSEAERSAASIAWSQLDGPAASFKDTDKWALIFSAPSVSADTLLRLQAVVQLQDGSQLKQEFRLLVQPVPHQSSQALFGSQNPASRVYPYVANSPHASALNDCIFSPQLTNAKLCPLSRLPLLGQETSGGLPSVEQVMQRVLVSNDWMGEAFENFLRTQDTNGDFRRLLNATTAVVIGGRVRPAFFWVATGAIYLDANQLWLTPEQRDTVSEVPDPRSDYGSALSYTTFWRYVLNNQYADTRFSVTERKSRSVSQLGYALGSLLYHELNHAGDFTPPASQQALDRSLPVWQAGPAVTPSDDLQRLLPFYSQQMVSLGRVQFFGATPSAQQLAYTPADIIGFFTADRVTDDYAYSLPSGATVPREDAAMLAEEAMMQLRYGVLRDVAILPPIPAGGTSADTLVSWGQRGRIGNPAIKPRAALVLARTMPWLPANALDALAAPLPLKPGLSWGQNLDQAAVAAQRPRELSAQERQIESDLNRRRQQQKALRDHAAQLGRDDPLLLRR